MNFVFLMDPLASVKMEKDTTFLLMLGAYRKGHRVYYLPDGGMTLSDGRIHFHTTEVVPQMIKEAPFILKKELILTDKQVDCVFIRSDPPFNYKYLMQTWILERLRSSVPVINDPQGIRTVNEKIWVTQFTSLIPKTLVGRNRDDLLGFLKTEKTIVAKPTDGYGGQSVFQLNHGDLNCHVILETLTQNYSRDIILQSLVKEARNGDKRILLLNGEPLGVVLRVHAKDDHRNNFFSGGKPKAAKINKRDKEIIKALKPKLKELGLYFVGIDILGKYLVEVNVTSPTCLQEMNWLYDQRLEERVIGFVEKLVQKRKL